MTWRLVEGDGQLFLSQLPMCVARYKILYFWPTACQVFGRHTRALRPEAERRDNVGNAHGE